MALGVSLNLVPRWALALSDCDPSSLLLRARRSLLCNDSPIGVVAATALQSFSSLASISGPVHPMPRGTSYRVPSPSPSQGDGLFLMWQILFFA